MSEAKKPETREEDSWFSEAQLERLAPADHADRVHSPIPTQMVSNGEYMPIGQTDKQKEVEARLAALSAQAAKELGMSRRKFLTTSGGFAASFIAMNQVFGEFFDVRADRHAGSGGLRRRARRRASSSSTTRRTSSARAASDPETRCATSRRACRTASTPAAWPDELGRVNFPWNPALVGLPNLNSNFHLAQYMKDVYLDSQVHGRDHDQQQLGGDSRAPAAAARRGACRSPSASRS